VTLAFRQSPNLHEQLMVRQLSERRKGIRHTYCLASQFLPLENALTATIDAPVPHLLAAPHEARAWTNVAPLAPCLSATRDISSRPARKLSRPSLRHRVRNLGFGCVSPACAGWNTTT
jgi:hypothetical protein